MSLQITLNSKPASLKSRLRKADTGSRYAVTDVIAFVEFMHLPSSDSPNRSSGNKNAVTCSLPSEAVLYAFTTPVMMLNTALAR
jgi:hypothetical protein